MSSLRARAHGAVFPHSHSNTAQVAASRRTSRRSASYPAGLLPFSIPASVLRRRFTICSGVHLFVDKTGPPTISKQSSKGFGPDEEYPDVSIMRPIGIRGIVDRVDTPEVVHLKLEVGHVVKGSGTQGGSGFDDIVVKVAV